MLSIDLKRQLQPISTEMPGVVRSTVCSDEALKSAFREYGLPNAIRTDNGAPFAGRCAGGLSRLSIWFIQLGIIPERIQKGCPQENGRHERMHKTLKDDALDPPAINLREQQRAFDSFRYDYNHYRPHESLNDQTPSEHYLRSTRPYVENPHKPGYDPSYLVRRVRVGGRLKFKGQEFFISKLLEDEPLGLKEVSDGLWQIRYSFHVLGSLDLRKKMIVFN
jgi:putative transposase